MRGPGRFAAASWVALTVLLVQVATAGAAGNVVPLPTGREATVAAPDGLNVRGEPSAASEVISVADYGDFVFVLAGPRAAGGEEWYSVEYEGTIGWVAGSFLAPPRDRAVSYRGGRVEQPKRSAIWLPVPYYSQYDGSAYARANCGPASLSMAIGAFGGRAPVGDIRRAANRLQGTAGWYDAGVAIDILADLARGYGMAVAGPRWGGHLDRWSFDEVRDALRKGHVVVPQVHLASLPGQEGSNRAIDHYIVITGFEGGRFYYNDPAFDGRRGHGLAMTEERLALAWKRGDHPFAAFSIGPGEAMRPLIGPRPQRTSESALAAARGPNGALARAAPTSPPLLLPASPDRPDVAGESALVFAAVPLASPAPIAELRDLVLTIPEIDGSVVPSWSGAVTQGEVDVAIGRVPLNTGATTGQLWAMLAGAAGLALFGARRQLARIRPAALASPFGRPSRRPARMVFARR